MSRNYKFNNPKGLYFVSFAVVYWLKVFVKTIYLDILVDSLHYCQQQKGMEIIAWSLMPNHVHLIFRSVKNQNPGLLLGDYKRFTSKAMVRAIMENPNEHRKELLLKQFKYAASNVSNVNDYQFWNHDNHPIELWSNFIIKQKIDYIHNNPVKARLVSKAEEYPYSSAKDYAGEEGILKNIVVFDSY